jgi:hypothetical protein
MERNILRGPMKPPDKADLQLFAHADAAFPHMCSSACFASQQIATERSFGGVKSFDLKHRVAARPHNQAAGKNGLCRYDVCSHKLIDAR